MLVVDTNVLVYAANVHSAFHKQCQIWLDRQRKEAEAWYTTWPIIYEFMRVTTHPRVMRTPWKATVAWQFIVVLLGSPGLTVLVPTERHSEVAAKVISEVPQLAGNVLHDAHTAILMREHGIFRVCTCDMDFHRFPFVEVIDPLRG